MIGATSSSSTIFTILMVFILAVVFSSTQVSAQEGRPIFMDRREAAPIGDILSELKGKGLGGRMRFGKRSMSNVGSLGAYRSIYDPQQQQQQFDFLSL